LIWPDDGFASIALPQRRAPTSFPCRLRRHSSRIKQVGARHPPLRSGSKSSAAPIAPGLPIAIEAAMVAGSKQRSEENYHGENPIGRGARGRAISLAPNG
jgi:hypothetical protein